MNKLSAYNSFFTEIINTINSARYQAFKSLNKFHMGQNFEIGRIIVENQEKNKWGQSIVDTLSKRSAYKSRTALSLERCF